MTMAASLDDTLALWWHGEVRLPESELIAWARRQRLLPLLGWRAQQLGWELPVAMTEAIRRSRMAVAAQQALTHQQLRTLGEIAQHLAIPVVLVKGAAAAEAYPEPWMRPYGDIDLLIDEADAAPLLQALKEQGYTYAESARGHRAWHFPALFPPGPGPRLEVHTALARERARVLFTVSQWQEALRPAAVHPSLATPSPVDHVLYLVHHAVIHHGLEMGLQGCADVGFWTRNWSSVEWQELDDKAKDLQLSNATSIFLELTEWFWGDGFLSRTTPLLDTPGALWQNAIDTIGQGAASERLPHFWRDLPGHDGRGVPSYLRTVIFGDPAQLRELTPRERLAFYLRRPVELLRNHGPALWQLVYGDPATRTAWHAQRDLQAWLRQG